MATTYKTKQSKFWFARFHDGSGKRISRSTKTESRREAKRIAASMEARARREVQAEVALSDVPRMIRHTVEMAVLELQQDRLTLQRAEELIRLMHQAAKPDDTGSSFRRFARDWLDAKEQTTATTTWRSYNDAAKAFVASLGATADGPLRSITVGDCERFQADLAADRRGRTVNYYFSVVRRILQSAVEKDLITKNPAKPITSRAEGDSRKRAEFSTEDVKAILRHAPTTEWHGLILLAATTGLRRGDLLALSTDNVVGDRLQIQPSKGRGKSGDIVNIPLRPESIAWLKGRTGALFPTIAKIKDTTVSYTFGTILQSAKVPSVIVLAAGNPPVIAHRSFHSLRHSFTSWLAEADVASDVRQKLTGHRSSKVHAGYTHHDKVLDRAIAALPQF